MIIGLGIRLVGHALTDEVDHHIVTMFALQPIAAGQVCDAYESTQNPKQSGASTSPRGRASGGVEAVRALPEAVLMVIDTSASTSFWSPW